MKRSVALKLINKQQWLCGAIFPIIKKCYPCHGFQCPRSPPGSFLLHPLPANCPLQELCSVFLYELLHKNSSTVLFLLAGLFVDLVGWLRDDKNVSSFSSGAFTLSPCSNCPSGPQLNQWKMNICQNSLGLLWSAGFTVLGQSCLASQMFIICIHC